MGTTFPSDFAATSPVYFSSSIKASYLHPLVPCPAIPSPHRCLWRCPVPDDAPGPPRLPDQGRRLHRRPGPLAPGTIPLVSLSGQPLPEISLIQVNTNYLPQRSQFIHSGLPGRGGVMIHQCHCLLWSNVPTSGRGEGAPPNLLAADKTSANRPMTPTPIFLSHLFQRSSIPECPGL